MCMLWKKEEVGFPCIHLRARTQRYASVFGGFRKAGLQCDSPRIINFPMNGCALVKLHLLGILYGCVGVIYSGGCVGGVEGCVE